MVHPLFGRGLIGDLGPVMKELGIPPLGKMSVDVVGLEFGGARYRSVGEVKPVHRPGGGPHPINIGGLYGTESQVGQRYGTGVKSVCAAMEQGDIQPFHLFVLGQEMSLVGHVQQVTRPIQGIPQGAAHTHVVFPRQLQLGCQIDGGH